MIVLGLDPGATTGWVAYDTVARYVVAHGAFREHYSRGAGEFYSRGVRHFDAAVIERPKGYGATRPQVVDCGYVCGRLIEIVGGVYECDVNEMLRLEVCKILTDATHGEVRVKNDATAWAALVLLHGEGSDRKPRRKAGKIVEPGGALGSVTGHARAALAVAVAWSLKQQQQEKSA